MSARLSDYELWNALRKPLPDWWLKDLGRDRSFPLEQGLAFLIERSGRRFRCVVPLRVLARLDRAVKGRPEVASALWMRYGDHFSSAGKRALAQCGFKVKGDLRLGFADIVLDD
jgi:hypothetical protein